jgi:hypothetical protein
MYDGGVSRKIPVQFRTSRAKSQDFIGKITIAKKV